MLQISLTISKRAALIIAVGLVLTIPGIAGATHIFTDVSDASVHSPGIEWVAGAGVTAGCGDGTTYCPGDSVSREQMGTFLCRLAGNCGVAPSVNSDEVDGYHANELIRFAGDEATGIVLNGVNGVAASVDITAPARGFLVISASSDVITGTGTLDSITCEIRVNGVRVDSSERTMNLQTTNYSENCSTDANYTVIAPGDYTVEFYFDFLEPTTDVEESVLNVLFVPFGGTGNPPGLVIVPLGA